jgi:hypothetical protein
LQPISIPILLVAGVLDFVRGPAHFGAVMAAIDFAILFHAVANHVTVAMGAFRREGVYRAFEAVKNVLALLAGDDDFERLGVIVATNFAACHGMPPLA